MSVSVSEVAVGVGSSVSSPQSVQHGGDAVTTLTAIALGDVEGDGAQRPAKLLTEIAISGPDSSNDGPEHLDGFDGDTESVEPMTAGG